jgi:hypothetical protein
MVKRKTVECEGRNSLECKKEKVRNVNEECGMQKRKSEECEGRKSVECRKGKLKNANKGRAWNADKERLGM